MILTKSGLEGLEKKIPNDGFKKSWLEGYFSLCDPSHTPVGILLWVTGQYFTMLQLNFFFLKKGKYKIYMLYCSPYIWNGVFHCDGKKHILILAMC